MATERRILIALALLFALPGLLVGVRAIQVAQRVDENTQRVEDNTRAVAALARRNDVDNCTSRNTIRAGIVSFLDGIIAQQANQAQAVLASPTADALEKRRAQATLDSLPDFQTRTHEKFAAESCPE